MLAIRAFHTSTATGDQDTAVALATEGLECASDDASRHFCLVSLAAAYVNSGRGSQALETARRALAVAGDDPEVLGTTFHLLVWVSWAADPDSIGTYAAHEHDYALTSGSRLRLASASAGLGFAALVAGSGDEAMRLFRESLGLAGTIPSVRGEALLGIASTAATLDPARAASAFHEAITDLYATRWWMYVWIATETLAIHWVSTGELEAGAVLLGHLQANNRSHASLVATRHEADEIVARQPKMRAAIERGAAMSRDDVVGYALERLHTP
jgi:hypothetical protein